MLKLCLFEPFVCAYYLAMRHVIVEREMSKVDPTSLWRFARAIVDFPKSMPSVISVEDVSLAKDGSKTSWQVLFNGNMMSWIEENSYNDARMSYSFEQVEGDLAEWRGQFSLKIKPTLVIARYDLYFDLGIPALAYVMEPLGEVAIRDNCNEMLREMEKQAAYVDHSSSIG